ncbi:phospholipase D/nuclease [Pholiota conissans]|uniref:phospholipase D n=1 Tax=Pholiota conissans TaxID=109636 RepID=A0A9P5YQZ3_9AGAR|nr:phospholipase D/nuclease [Pholiota conissans]
MNLLNKVVGHARAEVIGILNPNRRHDDPEEIAQDELRAEIRRGHRYESFAAERSGNSAKWHVDGYDYMWALSEMIDKAKEVIFITDWWLTPELYLRRPAAYFPEWRLDKLLQRKAQEGVRIHVIVYKEVTQTMSMSSKHTKAKLEALHPNITCMRHPDHIGAKDSVQFWSHHEKIVLVDNQYAAIGGLDLCFGRWDTHTHPLADVHPTDFSKTLFPGQDFNNARVMDFKDVYDYVSNTLSIMDNARMPWHDVHMTFEGPAVLDIAQHFIERWNEIKKRKYRDKENVPWLALPHDPEYAPNEAVARHPHLEQWKAIGRKYRQRWHGPEEGSSEESESRGVRSRIPKKCRVQAVRSVSDWSHGVLTEHSIQDAYIQLIKEAEHYIYIENQFFISATKTGGSVVNQIGAALVERIVRAGQEGKKFKVVVVIPEVPGFAGDIKTEGSIKTIMAAQYRTINRGGSSIYEEVRKAGYEPMDFIRFYHLRSYDRINAPQGFIQQIEINSGVKFHEAQVALSAQWVDGDALTTQKEIVVVIPQEESLVPADKPETQKTEKVPIPQDVEAARQVVERFEAGASNLRSDEPVSDNVAQHMLNDGTSLLEEVWLGTEEEELNAYVSELLYIHSKLMIVDDRRVIMGSANINDRSQKGDGDSEIALVIEDDDMINSTMDGESYEVSRFAATLRRQLYKEHLGLIEPQLADARDPEVTSFMRPAPFPNKDETRTHEDRLVSDPLADATNSLWMETARKNREIFTELFRPIPTNLVRNWEAYDNYRPKTKTGHLVPGIPLERVKTRLNQVKGALVECPLDFLIDDKALVTGPEWTVLNPTLPIYI